MLGNRWHRLRGSSVWPRQSKWLKMQQKQMQLLAVAAVKCCNTRIKVGLEWPAWAEKRRLYSTVREVSCSRRTIGQRVSQGRIHPRSYLVSRLRKMLHMGCKVWTLFRSRGTWSQQRWIRSGYTRLAKSAACLEARLPCHTLPPRSLKHPFSRARVA